MAHTELSNWEKEKEEWKGRHFVASYSGGKDSMLAIYRALRAGMIPVELLITFRTEKERSWFHGVPETVLKRVSEALKIPVRLIQTTGEGYTRSFEQALKEAVRKGADCCVFGDIDLEEHRSWCSERCTNTGLKPCFPLWEESREALVYEMINAGFLAQITVVHTKRLGEAFLGELLTEDIALKIKATGADICGENGEYHTFVYDGPIFDNPVAYEIGSRIFDGDYFFLSIQNR